MSVNTEITVPVEHVWLIPWKAQIPDDMHHNEKEQGNRKTEAFDAKTSVTSHLNTILVREHRLSAVTNEHSRPHLSTKIGQGIVGGKDEEIDEEIEEEEHVGRDVHVGQGER